MNQRAMMDQAPFIQAILESPNDPVPVWIFADWLEERGHLALAELVRIEQQIETYPLFDKRRLAFEVKANQIARREFRNRNQTQPRASKWRSAWGMIERRSKQGLIDRIIIDSSKMSNSRSQIQALFRLAPVRSLTLTKLSESAALVWGNRPELRYLSELHIKAGCPKAINQILKSPHLVNLEFLSCPSLTLRPYVSAREWLESLPFVKLKALRIDYQYEEGAFSDSDAIALAESARLNQLTTLEFVRGSLTDLGVAALMESAGLRGLKSLNLSYNQIGYRGAKILAESPHLANLEQLSLASNNIGQGAARLASSRLLSGLVDLNLANNAIGNSGWHSIFTKCRLPRLARLNMSANPFRTNLGFLKQADFLGSLSILQANFDIFESDSLLTPFSFWPLLEQLSVLEMCQCRLDDRSAETLARSPRLANLVRLRLTENAISQNGATSLAVSPRLDSLAELDLRNNPFSLEAQHSLLNGFGHRLLV